jgi:hypothetical protein
VAGYRLCILKTGERFTLVGSVPVALCTPKDGPFGPDYEVPSWDTEAEAIAALRAAGYTGFRLSDLSLYQEA